MPDPTYPDPVLNIVLNYMKKTNTNIKKYIYSIFFCEPTVGAKLEFLADIKFGFKLSTIVAAPPPSSHIKTFLRKTLPSISKLNFR